MLGADARRVAHQPLAVGRRPLRRTRCTSSPNDSRRAAVTTSISATDSTISLNETGDYTFVIKDTNCHASVTRSRSFSLVHREGETPPAASASAAPVASATPAPAPTPPPAEPRAVSRCSGGGGDPARLEVHPAKKLLRAGDKFTFRAIVLDAEGCQTGTKPTWTLAPGPVASKATVDGTGTLAVEADAPEGRLEVSVAVGGKGDTVNVEVASPEHYDALLGLSGLNDAGEAEQAAVAVIAVGTIGGRTAVAQDGARERKVLFVAIVGALATVLGFFGLVLVRRGTRKVEPLDDGGEPQTPAPAVEEEPAPPSSGVDPRSGGAKAVSRTPGPQGATGETPGPEPAPTKTPPPRGKICPTCGERYPGEAAFCGKDATTLVLLN